MQDARFRFFLISSFPRKWESKFIDKYWIPVFTGMTAFMNIFIANYGI